MEYQTIKENGKVKFVVLPVDLFETILDRIEDESDLRDIREAKSEPLYDQNEAEDYIFMNPVKREGAVYRKATRQKLAKVFRISETSFS